MAYLFSLFVALFSSISLAQTSVNEQALEQGKYLFQAANCYSCHTDIENNGKPLAGGRALDTEFGRFMTPNITADKETGIGHWSNDDFINAMKHGISPSQQNYYPSFPYTSYAGLTDQDILLIKDYLFSLPTVNQKNQSHDLEWFIKRFSISVWKLGNAGLQEKHVDKTLQRGSYLINHLGHCGECHTPRNQLGHLDYQQHLTGNSDLEAPNIRNVSEGIEDWTDSELVEFFEDGVFPDGDYASDHMAEVIEFSTAFWTKEDMQSAIAYLRSIQ